MKKRILTLALCALMVLSLFTGCGGKDEGSVYWLNFKPEADAALQEIAKTYEAETGVKVKIVTAASGEYNTQLIAELDKKEPPTLFNVGNPGAVKTYGDYCYDLTGTPVFNELNQDIILYTPAGTVASIGYCTECFGIIVNKALLKEAGYDISDITDFASLKAIADDIHTRAGELGFDAFSSAGLDGTSSWRFSGHLANMPLYYEFRDDGITSQPATIKGSYLDAYKNIWDLYITDSATTGADLASATGDMSSGEFKERKAVFYQNGSWEYAGLIEAGFTDDELQMIPLYCGVEGEEKAGLCSGTENCWAVNKNASEADIQATLDFMYWMVTSEAGTKCMSEQFGVLPYKQAPETSNLFIKNSVDYVAEGKYSVSWAFNFTPAVDDWRAGVVDALTKYTAGTGDWAGVETAFVQGWAQQYAAENQG
ncbi:MAG: ABC transporter substrate-binding protein [Oscillospiraceae bacterium]